MAIYKITNNGSRGQAFRTAGGNEVVKAGATRVLDLSDELTEERIALFGSMGVELEESSDKPENAPTVSYARYKTEGKPPAVAPKAPEEPKPVQADKPAETGGVVAQSSVSEKGGVDRKEGDTTTTTKPTTEHKGAKA